MLTGLVLLIDEAHELSRALVALLVSMSFFAAQWFFSPFKRRVDNWLAATMHFCLALIFTGEATESERP